MTLLGRDSEKEAKPILLHMMGSAAMTFVFKNLVLPGVVLVERSLAGDDRGFFSETFKESEFTKAGILGPFVQDNLSRSKKGVLRGLHYQLNPAAQSKLVTVIRGAIFDVAVDLRRNSQGFGTWVGEVLSEENRRSLYIPEGFAHGFCVLSDEADVIYKVNKEYSAQNERGIVWNDSRLSISWPLLTPLLSAKDAKLPSLQDAEMNFEYSLEPLGGL